ncbi:MAG: HAD family hydrolase, partial [Muribaculaceae bacterium]
MNEIDAIKNYLSAAGLKHFDLQAALIDMDGVLYDSMRNHTAAWYRMATEMGIECCRDEFYLYEGMTGAATIDILFNRAYGRCATADEARELYARKALYFTELGAPVMMPDADRMLSTLKISGLLRVLVTGSGQQSILDRIDRDYPGIFLPGNRVTARNVTHGK